MLIIRALILHIFLLVHIGIIFFNTTPNDAFLVIMGMLFFYLTVAYNSVLQAKDMESTRDDPLRLVKIFMFGLNSMSTILILFGFSYVVDEMTQVGLLSVMFPILMFISGFILLVTCPVILGILISIRMRLIS